MSLHPEPIGEIPTETKQVAQAAFPRGNVYLKMRDELGVFYQDTDFVELYARCGQPAYAPWRLALILIMQFVEGLSDRQASDAVRARIDWKYALGLKLTDAGFDYSILSEFRSRLVDGNAAELLFERMLEQFKNAGLLKARGKQRTDSTHILAAIRHLNRLETVGETLRAALNKAAKCEPQWLANQVTADWFKRYGLRVEEYRLPKGEQKRAEYAAQIGADGFVLLEAIDAPTAPPRLAELPAVKVLRALWEQQFVREENGAARLKKPRTELAAAAERIDSPYDSEARFATKRSTSWVGYKVHLTEICDDDQLHLITQVETTNAAHSDIGAAETIQQKLAHRQTLPDEHFLDTGYIDARLLVQSRQRHQIKVIGPARQNYHWQAATENGFSLEHFQIDWEQHKVKCPAEETSVRWSAYRDKRQDLIKVSFRKSTCLRCRHRSQCTRSETGPREFLLRPREQHEALIEARKEQQTTEWKRKYERRAGIEGTISQGVRGFGLRQARYLGQAKAHLQNTLTATAINLWRTVAWLNDVPQAMTRTSQFAKLAKVQI